VLGFSPRSDQPEHSVGEATYPGDLRYRQNRKEHAVVDKTREAADFNDGRNWPLLVNFMVCLAVWGAAVYAVFRIFN
jgi:hypothetical protein